MERTLPSATTTSIYSHKRAALANRQLRRVSDECIWSGAEFECIVDCDQFEQLCGSTIQFGQLVAGGSNAVDAVGGKLRAPFYERDFCFQAR